MNPFLILYMVAGVRGELCYWYHPEDSHSDRCLPCGDRVAAVIPSETLAPAALKDDGLVSDLVILLAGVYGFFLSDIALGFYGGLETSLAETSIVIFMGFAFARRSLSWRWWFSQ